MKITQQDYEWSKSPLLSAKINGATVILKQCRELYKDLDKKQKQYFPEIISYLSKDSKQLELVLRRGFRNCEIVFRKDGTVFGIKGKQKSENK